MATRFSNGYQPAWLADLPDRSGAGQIVAECARQHADARRTLTDNAFLAERVAADVRHAGRLSLFGMGASHFANRIAAARLCALGVDAVAVPASEALYSPPANDNPVIVTSQSGRSAEITGLLDRADSGRIIAGVTLNPDEPYGAVPTLLGAGGMEQAFAATRSFTVTLAAFAALLAALGAGEADAIPASEPPIDAGVDQAFARVAAVRAFVASGRGAFEGVAALTALNIAELARIPAAAHEGGQFRHGIVEMLSPHVGVIVFRAAGPSASKWRDIGAICVRAGAPLVVLDASGLEPIPDALTIECPAGEGLASIYRLLPTLQALVLGIAAQRVPDVGAPRFCTKITDSE